MVLESLIGEKSIKQNPILITIITFVISIGSIIFAYAIFPNYVSVLSISFITIGLVPIIHGILKDEEFGELLERKYASNFLSRHSKIVQIYVWIFVGVILAFMFAYIFSPMPLKQTLFQEQINSFCLMSGNSCELGIPKSISGLFALTAFNACQNPETKNIAMCSFFIFENNAIVLVFTIILSLLYGAGALFIIAWNASIIGIFFGEMFLSEQFLRGLGLLQGMLIGHGPPELLGYIFGALAGGVLSAMVSRGQFYRHEFSTIIKDFFFLSFLALFSVLYGAVVEGIGLIGHTEVYFVLGFFYVLIVLLLLIFFGKK